VPVEGDWPLGEGEDAFLLHIAGNAFSSRNKPARIGVAVSGGSDSMAALHLMVRAGEQLDWAVEAVTVDHQLRAEAVQEAQFVADACRRLGVTHDVLRWEHGVITGNLQDQASRARYALIGEWARGRGISDVVLGHTADDQAETFLMGLAREAGLDGLTGMRPQWQDAGVGFHRPFLGTTRNDLRAYLLRNCVGWKDDPSNENDQFTRVKARRILKTLKPMGITVDKLGGTIFNLSRARQALVETVFDTAGRISDERAGEVIFDRSGLRRASQEVIRRLLVAALRWVSGAQYAPRADAVVRLEIAVYRGRDATLSGCRIRVTDTEVRVVREPKAVASVVCSPGQLWDGRWLVEGPSAPGLEVRALGAEALRACKDWRETGHSRDALLVSPAIWRGEVLVAAPLAGFSNGWTARIDAGFSSFIISH
jgi:tRNA(Ile)-lysidine synthase